MQSSSENLAQLEAAMSTMKQALARAREHLADGLELTRTQLEILMLLANSPQTTGELARRLFLTQSAVTQTVDTLVRRNLLVRHHSEADRRIIQLELSPAGRAVTDELQALRSRKLQLLSERLTTAEIQLLDSVTKKFVTVLNEIQSSPTKDKKGE